MSPVPETGVTREAAWLTSVVSGLPNLLLTDSPSPGKFDVVQAYDRKYPKRGKCIYVLRESIAEKRAAMGGLKVLVYELKLQIYWSITSANNYEEDQQNFDNAVSDVLAKVRGPFGDKSHGGRFYSAGEEQDFGVDGQIFVEFTDPQYAQTTYNALKATMRYQAIDTLFTG